MWQDWQYFKARVSPFFMLDEDTCRCVLFLPSFLQDSITPRHRRNGNKKNTEYLMADDLEIKHSLVTNLYGALCRLHLQCLQLLHFC